MTGLFSRPVPLVSALLLAVADVVFAGCVCVIISASILQSRSRKGWRLGGSHRGVPKPGNTVRGGRAAAYPGRQEGCQGGGGGLRECDI